MQDATYDDWDWILSVNLGGVINGIQTFVPRIIQYGQGGHVVNTSSHVRLLSYARDRHLLYIKICGTGFTESLRIDLEPYNIGVSVLCPGAVNTNIHEAVRNSRSI